MEFESMVNECYKLLENTKTIDNLVLPNMVIEISPVRLHWKNVISYLQVINRNPEHFIDFIKRELPDKQIGWYSSDKSEGLLIHASKQKKNTISALAIKYVNSYVLCLSCKKYNSELNRDSDTKKYEFKCNECGFNKFI